jgi:hypothetical protein
MLSCCFQSIIGICARAIMCVCNCSLVECCIDGYLCVKLLKCCDNTKTAIKDCCESMRAVPDAETINHPHQELQAVELGGETV